MTGVTYVLFFFSTFLLFIWPRNRFWGICHARKCIANMRAFRGDNITIIIYNNHNNRTIPIYYSGPRGFRTHSFSTFNRRRRLGVMAGYRRIILYIFVSVIRK